MCRIANCTHQLPVFVFHMCWYIAHNLLKCWLLSGMCNVCMGEGFPLLSGLLPQCDGQTVQCCCETLVPYTLLSLHLAPEVGSTTMLLNTGWVSALPPPPVEVLELYGT